MAGSVVDDCDEVAEGLPRIDDPFIQKYLAGRSALIAQEKKQRSGDYAFRQALSATAAEACAIVSKIRDEERRTIWTPRSEDSLALQGEVNIYPGMMFILAKERMEQTRLWEIVRKMPKGALLHAHLDAMVDMCWLIDLLLSTPGMHMFSPEPLVSQNSLEQSSVLFTYAETTGKEVPSIWSPEYVPYSLCSVTAAANSFPDGSSDGFSTWLKGRCTIGLQESVTHHLGPNDIWTKFESAFFILDSIIFYEPIFRKVIHRVCSQLHDEGVCWVELRAAFAFEYRREGCSRPEKGYEEVLRVFGEEIESFKTSEEGRHFWGARLIWTLPRSFDTRQIVEGMKQCIANKKLYPDLIAGFDLVGHEVRGRTLKDLTPALFWFRKRCMEEGVEIPFFFHAGECLGDGDETDQNLFDAVLLGTRRIGHGFSLYKHPLLIDMVKEKRILVESCPISNEVLRLTSSIMSHPLPALLSRGVSVALCNDDPGIFGQDTSGSTHDFWQALQAWDNLGLEGLGALAENSVRWAAFDDQSAADWTQDIKEASLGSGARAIRMKEWAVQWERFCQWIVEEYDSQAEADPVDPVN